MSSNFHEKRRIQRIRLDCPITAKLGNTAVDLVDLSASGACIEHPSALKTGSLIDLHFSYEDELISAACVVVRSRLQKRPSGEGAYYRSGLQFNDPKGPEVAALRRIVIDFVKRDLDARRAHARPT
jgi:hypothetical protein